MYFRTARCQVKLAKAHPCQLFARDDLKRSISKRAHLITSLSPPAQNLHPRFKLGSLCPGNSSNKSENWFRFIFPPSQVLVPIWEATMDNWQGANIQNPHKLGVVLIASRAFPGNNFVPLPTSVTCVWPINWRIRDRPRQALLECSTPGCYRHAKTCRSCRPESAIFLDLVLIILLICCFSPFSLISVVFR